MSDRSVLSPDLLGFLPPESVEFTDVCVGRGGSGIVHRGWYTPADGDRIEVAIKALAPGATDREIRHFQKEYTIHWTASKKCSGACVLFCCVHRGTDLCLVMKLYTGGSLHELLDARRDPVDEAKRQPLSASLVLILQPSAHVPRRPRRSASSKKRRPLASSRPARVSQVWHRAQPWAS